MNLNSLKHYLEESDAEDSQGVLVYLPRYRRYFKVAATDVQHRGLVLITEASPTEVNYPNERSPRG
jgi:hypothetical protein